MPGIAAIIETEVNENLVRSMIGALKHEDWQRSDLYLQSPLAVGRVHLGTVNPESQPIFNEDKSIYIMMDGEIFDYEKEVKSLELAGHRFSVVNGAEYCLHLYEEYGEECVNRLNGTFVLVIHDLRKGRIVIANDRHGMLPLYYTKNGERFIFASEVKAILSDATFKKEINDDAVADFFAFGKIFGNKTLFKRIRVMPPASIMIWSKGKIYKRKYWELRFVDECRPDLDEEYYSDHLAGLLKKAVDRRTKDRFRLGVFLSGGMDSRTVAGAIDRKYYPVNTFTYGIREGDEARIAERIAGKLGTKHEFVELKGKHLALFAQEATYLTDGMWNILHFFWVSTLPLARKNCDVMFHGLAMDIMLSTVSSHTMFAHFFGGGQRLFLEREISKSNEDNASRLFYEFFNSLVTEEMMPIFFSEDYYKKIKNHARNSFERCLKEVKEKKPVNRLDSFWLLFFGQQSLSRTILRNYCVDRIPSLDNDFVDFVLKVPARFRFGHQQLYFRTLAKLNPELARIPYQRTGVPPVMPIIAHRIGFLIKGSYKFLCRKLRTKTRGLISLPERMGYPNVGEWIRKDKDLRSYVENTLLDKRTLKRGYFNSDFIVHMVEDHMSEKKDWTELLCALITFELWNRRFIDPD
jgi:asparagine synthase (glutamine-hydrolysing)